MLTYAQRCSVNAARLKLGLIPNLEWPFWRPRPVEKVYPDDTDSATEGSSVITDVSYDTAENRVVVSFREVGSDHKETVSLQAFNQYFERGRVTAMAEIQAPPSDPIWWQALVVQNPGIEPLLTPQNLYVKCRLWYEARKEFESTGLSGNVTAQRVTDEEVLQKLEALKARKGKFAKLPKRRK